MSYAGISIREAMEKINHINNGWYLPQVQRQYVWGARYESETYICLLFDSLYRRYPIGGLVLWDTSKSVPFREFIDDYYLGNFAKRVPSGRWASHKGLIYDGQQRLQTLRSALYYTFNGRILCFNLMFDKDTAQSDETGFFFIDKQTQPPVNCITMPELISFPCDLKEKVKLKNRFTKGQLLSDEEELLVESNIGSLWEVFVDITVKSIAFFAVVSNDEQEVNEVFRRLNTGGMALNQLDMVLSKIKAIYSDYEERLWVISSKIEKQSGLKFSSSEILQFLYLIIFDTVKIDDHRVKILHIHQFDAILPESESALLELFDGYLWGQLKINNNSIIPRQQAILPIAIYLFSLKRNKHDFEIKKLTQTNLELVHQYFLLSQFCDWNTQTMINAFSKLAKEAGEEKKDFPLDLIRQVALLKNRSDTLYYHQFISQPWLALKVLTPNRYYIFLGSKPQVDHIFPLSLKGGNAAYRMAVDVLWNFQPMVAGVNNYKRAKHPVNFFKSPEGTKFFTDYDFVPQNLNSTQWSDEKKFIRYRHKKMRQELFSKYGLRLKRLRP
jgi:hypothetical protein